VRVQELLISSYQDRQGELTARDSGVRFPRSWTLPDQRLTGRFAFPFTASLNLLLLLALALGFLISPHLPTGMDYRGPLLGNILLTKDGLWYADIAVHGYHWDALRGGSMQQNAAFFPLYPMLEWVVIKLTGGYQPLPLVALGLVFGVWSNFAFSRLAARLLPGRSARWATAFFIFWPASCFLAMGYPTGLINLCAVATLHHLVDGRRLRAAIWCGIGAAMAPSMVFMAFAYCALSAAWWLQASRKPVELAKLCGGALITVSGVIGFIIFLQLRFHHPFAFVTAQGAWRDPVDVPEHLFRMFNPYWYAFTFVDIYTTADQCLHHHLMASTMGREQICQTFQFLLGFMAFALGAYTVIQTLRTQGFTPVAVAGLCLLLGYLWCMATTSMYFFGGIRMLYPAAVIMLGLARIQQHRTAPRAVLLGVFVVLGMAETALVGAGYIVA